MDVSDFDFELPQELIAQAPLPQRDAARLLVLPRLQGPVQHRRVRDLPSLLRPGDLLVVNDARVIPARLRGRKAGSGGKVELLLVEALGGREWLALGQASKPLREGQVVELPAGPIRIRTPRGGGEYVVELPVEGNAVWPFLEKAGEVPLPPYIERAPDAADHDRYQTVFAKEPGAVAAPTAGLHFTPELIAALEAGGIRFRPLTLFVGPGTFLPVRAQRTEDHRMHREKYVVEDGTVQAHRETRERGGRVIAVGTTALRTLEAAWDGQGLRSGPGSTDLFITPGYTFRAVDGLFTNFHLPKSTLLMLVSALAGLDRTLAAYREAVGERYRFFSYGDAMLIS